MSTDNSAPTTIQDITPKMKLKGVVKKIELYGALVDVGIGRLGLLHISQLSQNHVKNVSDVLSEGQEITVWVRDVDRKRGRINLTMLEMPDLSWGQIAEGQVYTGQVVRLEKFGAFVDIGAERPGLVHVSELTNGYVSDPADVVSVGDEIQVKVIGVNRRKKQIDLSVRALEAPAAAAMAQFDDDDEDLPTAMELALRQAMEKSGMELPSRTNKSKRRKKKYRRADQEEIFARTLQEHVSNQ